MTPITFLRTYRFQITLHAANGEIIAGAGEGDGPGPAIGERALDGRKLPVSIEAIAWSGRDLLISRGMRADPNVSLIRELFEVGEIRMTMFDKEVKPARVWRIEHEGMRDRGFDFMHAARDEIAREVVCLLNASMHRIQL